MDEYPVCLEGKRNCPHEDCGRTWRYANLLAILKQPGHEEYETYAEWLGSEFDRGQQFHECKLKFDFTQYIE